MSKDDLFSKKRSFSFHQRPSDNKNQRSWNSSKIKNKLFYKANNAAQKAFKKLGPNKVRKSNWVSKKIKRAMHKEGQPPTPHNTTQFIVDAIHYPTDPYTYEFDNNWFEQNFEKHAMAGSMMDLMQERIRRDSEEVLQPQEGTSINEEKDEVKRPDINYDLPKLRMVKSADDSENVTSASDTETKSYDQFLKEAEDGKDLKDVIKQLVHVIKRKDSQIISLLSNNEKKEFTEES